MSNPDDIRNFVKQRQDVLRVGEKGSFLKYANKMENVDLNATKIEGEAKEIAKMINLIKETNDQISVYKSNDEKVVGELRERLEMLTGKLLEQLKNK